MHILGLGMGNGDRPFLLRMKPLSRLLNDPRFYHTTIDTLLLFGGKTTINSLLLLNCKYLTVSKLIYQHYTM